MCKFYLKSPIDICFSDKEHYFSQKGYVMDTQNLNINTHIESLSTLSKSSPYIHVIL